MVLHRVCCGVTSSVLSCYTECVLLQTTASEGPGPLQDGSQSVRLHGQLVKDIKFCCTMIYFNTNFGKCIILYIFL